LKTDENIGKKNNLSHASIMKPTIAFMADLNQTAFMGMQERLLRRKNKLD
jgi:hypothetical protein